MHFNETQKQDIADGYREYTVDELAMTYNCASTAIRAVLAEKKVTMRRRGQKPLK